MLKGLPLDRGLELFPPLNSCAYKNSVKFHKYIFYGS